MTWKKISSEEKYKNRYMTVTEDVVEAADGATLTMGIVHKEPAVLIITWDGNKTTLVRQYRYSVGHDSWEFPQGHYEHESVEEAAIEELREETGVRAKSIKEIGTFDLAPGHHTQTYNMFLVDEYEEGEPEREVAERGMITDKFTLEEIYQMIRSGDITDSPTITGLKIFELYLGENNS